MLACDELAFYLLAEDRKQRTAVAELLRDLVARGRAAGVIVCAATQKPAADVVPSALRDLFGFRLALRCNTRDASDTILGVRAGRASGHDASSIAPGQRGVGLLLAEDGAADPHARVSPRRRGRGRDRGARERPARRSVAERRQRPRHEREEQL